MWEAESSKVQQLRLATQVVRMVLKIDDIIEHVDFHAFERKALVERGNWSLHERAYITAALSRKRPADLPTTLRLRRSRWGN